jgi:hypothetical protein
MSKEINNKVGGSLLLLTGGGIVFNRMPACSDWCNDAPNRYTAGDLDYT